MSPEEQKRRESEEAERLRTDTAFAAAVKGAEKAAKEELARLNALLAEEMVMGRDTREVVGLIVLTRARIDAISAITTEIAGMIVRGRANDGPDRA